MWHTAFLLVAILTSSRGSPLDSCKQVDTLVCLPTGKYTGLHDPSTSTIVYYAIPYAYSFRFEASQLIDTKPGIPPNNKVNASQHGAACINFNLPPPYDSGFNYVNGGIPIEPQSEDCLSMDVYVPDGDFEDLPVLFYTPGGGFLVAASFSYDMRSMVSRSASLGKPFIGVVINYRLGPLGFLNPSIWFDDRVNLGLLDQINALRYVKKYIDAFGGSPDKVTIMGESAGGESTMYQLLWTDESLFRSAWMMSVPTTTEPFLAPEPKPRGKDSLVKQYADACGCPSPENIIEAEDFLRIVDTQILQNNSKTWAGSMTSLGGFVRSNVFDTIRAGDFPDVPVALSICRDEGTAAAFGFRSNDTKTTSFPIYNTISGAGLNDRRASVFLEKMLEAYPNDPTIGAPFDGRNVTYGVSTQFKRQAAIETDLTFAEGWIEFLKTFSTQTRTWGMIFEQPVVGSPPYGVAHGSDLLFYFPDLVGPKGDPRNRGWSEMMYAVHDAVINFVHYGDPNGCDDSAGYRWPEFSESHLITALNGSHVTTAVPTPHRPGFDVIHKYLRPGPAAVSDL